MSDETRRLIADLPLEDAELLAETAERVGMNKLTTLVRAIRVLSMLTKLDSEGGEVILKEKDGSRSRLVLS